MKASKDHACFKVPRAKQAPSIKFTHYLLLMFYPFRDENALKVIVRSWLKKVSYTLLMKIKDSLIQILKKLIMLL